MDIDYYLTRSKKLKDDYLWIPYCKDISKIKTAWLIKFQGGEIEVALQSLSHVAFFGISDGEIPIRFIFECEKYNVQLAFYTRNASKRFILSNPGRQGTDILTLQINSRSDERRLNYLGRVILKNKLQSKKLIFPKYVLPQLDASMSIPDLRISEAKSAKVYWKGFYSSLQVRDCSRKTKHPLNQMLNAGYFFLSTSMIRWLHHYGFSVFHGFLHSSTRYEALVWDLIEPYRFIVEKAVIEVWQEQTKTEYSDDELVRLTITRITEMLNTQVVWVHSTQQYVKLKSVLQGAVLALRAYLLGDQHFVLPLPSAKKGGRPPKVSYILPGQIYKEQLKSMEKK